MALLGDRVGDPLHTNEEKIGRSQVLMGLFGFKIWVEAGECLGWVNYSWSKDCQLIFANILT